MKKLFTLHNGSICRSLAVLGLGVALFYVAGFAYLWIWGDRAVFEIKPPSYHKTDCAFIEGRNGSRIAFHYAENPGAHFTLIYSHGSASDIGMLKTITEAHRKFGFNVLVYDYPGVGHSSGSITEQGCYETIEDVYRYVRDKRGVPAKKVILYGRSIGTGPTLYLAEREKVAGVILVSPFTSALDVDFLTRIFPFEKFPNIQRIGESKSPVLILHGKKDENIPWQNAVELHKAAREDSEIKLLEGAGHEDIQNVPAYWRELGEFLRKRER